MKVSKLLSLSVLMAVLTAAWVGNAVGQTSPRNTVARVQKHAVPAPKTAAKTRKVSSFAPHPTKRRVFGAPIQPPIVNKAPPPKKPSPR